IFAAVTGSYAATSDNWIELVDQISTHAGAVRVLLRLAPFADLRLLRSFFSSHHDPCRRPKTSFYRGRDDCLLFDVAAGNYFDRRNGKALGRQALGEIAPRRLRRRSFWRNALLPAG